MIKICSIPSILFNLEIKIGYANDISDVKHNRYIRRKTITVDKRAIGRIQIHYFPLSGCVLL